MTNKPANLVDIDDPMFRITPMQQVFASCTGAIITSLFVTPLDVVKIRLQAQNKAPSKCFLYCNGLMDHFCSCSEQEKWFDSRKRFTGTMDAFVKITRNEGVVSLWSGLSPTLVLAVPATVAYFVCYEQLRLKLKDNYNKNRPLNTRPEQPLWIPLLAGATARTLSVTIVSPLELIRTKMQSTRLSYFEIGEALRALINANGIFGLWKGVFATLLRDVPFSAIYWTSYETMKAYFTPSTPSFWFSFTAGALSGGIAATLTVPFDVVKTHQQIEIGDKVLDNKPSKAESTFKVMSKMHREFGLRGLFVGLVPRLIKVAPACAIMIATFEHSKIAFNRLANRQYLQGEGQNIKPANMSSQSNVIDINVQSNTKDVL